ncbi:hypothetical protein QAD02_006681 [Eretmocerus hayati]|uniref:Uncharacterized protein n=1 Tax=Eretmocerus hayati TaxID=131215 RepID=A0ACC2N1J3_9HYME|nr:hypothetical protein QAD02_006681 [Eretmocerus hayati]
MSSFDFRDVVPVYFARLFPFGEFYEWLSYGEEINFIHREFSFNFEGERYLRHQAFKNINELKQMVKKYRPAKIDIGAIYNVSPAHRLKNAQFFPTQKEFIIDIDITDYDEIRTCCSGVDICCKCWKYLAIAIKILDQALREDFGFNSILWTFSGRRGVHCWVCDQQARLLKKSGRWAVANYLQLVTGGEFMKKKVTVGDKIHHSAQRALKLIEPIFIEMCVIQQNMLGTESNILKFLGILNTEEMRQEVKELMDQFSTSLERWEAFVCFFRSQIQSGIEIWCETPFLLEEILLQYSYPRLDIQVSLGLTHLLKAPFSIHPSTGKIGVPIDLNTVDHFNPLEVPSICNLVKEIDEFDAQALQKGMSMGDLRDVQDIRKTSLHKFLEIFLIFLQKIQKNTSSESKPKDLRDDWFDVDFQQN